MQTLFLPNALLPHGWARDVLVMLAPDGRIASLVSDSVCPPHAERLAGAAIAGIPNLHSHAHQRAIAGLAEHSGDRPDTFWTWREVMYRALDRMDPDDFEVHTQVCQGMMSHLMSLIVHGVFEKFPDLRVLMVESTLAWVPWLLLTVFVFVWGLAAVKTQLEPSGRITSLRNCLRRSNHGCAIPARRTSTSLP